MPGTDPDEKLRAVDLGLTNEERVFLVTALEQWGGPARPTDEVARVADFHSATEMADGLDRIAEALVSGEPLSRRDWRRSLVAAEIVFGSDTYGAGVEWETVTGRDDAESLKVLRELQRKLVGVCPPVI